ncbi:zinc-binding dehydrogenase [Nocardia sp. CDC153]|uniref:zinc-binding dehydrogenase n=1 Tax=Nocardia sp. CDC153 TaxID=3112167 RepID=UPI002DBCBC07|nr:zinc-binding dehydrogenase [Nocardia sp. CDC153]MEC3956415.1 zinc-binding dehydrogenase [Nocardia sp. CDC153]
MRALVSAVGHGGWTSIEEVDTPVPRAGEALVRVHEFGLNRADYLYLRRGVSGFRPGLDGAGVVAAADGDGAPEVGTAVAFHLPSGGAAAEFVAVPVDRLARVPAELPLAVAAAVPLPGLVAVRLLELAGPLAGTTVLATGMGGGVGQFIVRLAVAEGATVIAMAQPELPTDHIEAAGAKIVHDMSAIPDGSVDIVLESVGGQLGSAAARKLRTAGSLLWFGQSSGQPMTLDFFEMLRAGGSLTLRQFVFDADGHPEHDTRELQRLLGMAAASELSVPIGHHHDWTHAAGLLEDMAAGRLRGKAVLTIP